MNQIILWSFREQSNYVPLLNYLQNQWYNKMFKSRFNDWCKEKIRSEKSLKYPKPYGFVYRLSGVGLDWLKKVLQDCTKKSKSYDGQNFKLLNIIFVIIK